MTIVLWGGGRMGTAIAHGLGRSRARQQVLVSERDPERRRDLDRLGFGSFDRNMRALAPEMAFVAVKHPDVADVLGAVREQLVPGTPVVSVAAGVDHRGLSEALGAAYPVCRARPNILVRDGLGNVFVQSDHGMDSAAFQRVRDVLSGLGELYLCEEAVMEQRTWESSSLPLVIVPELLRRQLLRIQDSAARRQAGAALLRALAGLVEGAQRDPAADLGEHLLRVRNDVATDAGLNGAALELLAQDGFWDTLDRAALRYRERELGQARQHVNGARE